MSKLYNILNSIITRVKKAETLPNWNQNDETAADYVKNRPFYTSDLVETVLIEEQTVTIDNDDYYIQLDGSLTFIEGETYKLTLNGVLYELVAKYGADWECTYIGNGNMVDETTEDTQPFAVDSYENGEIYLDVAELGDYTISISGKVFEVHKIDEKYLPAGVPLIQTAEVGQVISVKAVDDEGKPTEWEVVDLPDDIGSGNSYDAIIEGLDFNFVLAQGSFEDLKTKILAGEQVYVDAYSIGGSNRWFYPVLRILYDEEDDEIEITTMSYTGSMQKFGIESDNGVYVY